MSELGTPQYPPPPAIGSQGFSSFDQDDPPVIDPYLINPPGTSPEPPTPGALPSPDEGSTFVLPPPDEQKHKRKGLKKLGGLGDSFRGGFSKVKGKFKRQTKIPDLHSIEAESEENLAGSTEYLDDDKQPYLGDFEAKSTDQLKQPSRLDSLGASLRNILKRPQNADPTPYNTGDVVELNPVKTNYVTFGNFINVMLIAFMIAGLIMCACIGVDDGLRYIGPAALGLGFFALVGKTFFYCFWQDDPVPEILKPATQKAGQILTPILGMTDPYGLKSGQAYGMNTIPATVFLGPMSTNAPSNVVQMEPFNYPRNVEPKMYDESIDTRMRPVSERRSPYSDQAPPTYSSYPTSKPAVKTPW